jgi:hypothetical protein
MEEGGFMSPLGIIFIKITIEINGRNEKICSELSIFDSIKLKKTAPRSIRLYATQLSHDFAFFKKF